MIHRFGHVDERSIQRSFVFFSHALKFTPARRQEHKENNAMNEQTQAASSPAEADVFEGRTDVGVEEYIRSRTKPADTAEPAPADPPKVAISEDDESESAGDSGAPNQQEKPKIKGALDRIAQLAAENANETDPAKKAKNQATIAKILKGAGLIETQAASSPAPAPHVTPQPLQHPPNQSQFTRPEPTLEDRKPDGTLVFESYEMFARDLARWDREQDRAEEQRKYAAAQREAQERAQTQAFEATKAELTSKYQDFEKVIAPFANEFIDDPRISSVVKRAVDDSAVYVELAYMLAKDAEFLDLARSDPGEARRYVLKVEGDIVEGSAAGRTATPAPQKTQAPRPPSPVSGGSSRAFDVSDESLPTDDWFRKRNKQLGIG